MSNKQFLDLFIGSLGMANLKDIGIISINLSCHSIQIFARSELMRLAGELEQTVITEPRKANLYPVESHFTYKGWDFFAVYNIGEE